jgi:deoxyribodipyrimidine photo-lyase
VHALRHYEPWWLKAEQELGQRTELCLHDGNQLAPPASIRTGAGGPYKIYSPFQRALFDRMPPPDPLPAPDALTPPSQWPASDSLDSWSLLPTKPDWASGFGAEWTPGEAGAHERLTDFSGRCGGYADGRNLPSHEGSSRLSPHLHFGEISPATVWHASDDATYRKELAWRDFATGLIAQFPNYGSRHGRTSFDAFPWRSGAEAAGDLRAWQRARTGYPIVDAGMRQLWTTGWMHNRVRMIAASFLVKHLLIDWREGERWFWDTLIDADYGNNSANWQWVAGTGVDSNRFARIMAPLVQSEKFDAAGYIREWVPELAHLPDATIHDPHEHGVAPPDYPPKLIEHRAARERALAAAETIRS